MGKKHGWNHQLITSTCNWAIKNWLGVIDVWIEGRHLRAGEASHSPIISGRNFGLQQKCEKTLVNLPSLPFFGFGKYIISYLCQHIKAYTQPTQGLASLHKTISSISPLVAGHIHENQQFTLRFESHLMAGSIWDNPRKHWKKQATIRRHFLDFSGWGRRFLFFRDVTFRNIAVIFLVPPWFSILFHDAILLTEKIPHFHCTKLLYHYLYLRVIHILL